MIADAIAAKEAAAAALSTKEARESVTVAEAWQVYVAERSGVIIRLTVETLRYTLTP